MNEERLTGIWLVALAVLGWLLWDSYGRKLLHRQLPPPPPPPSGGPAPPDEPSAWDKVRDRGAGAACNYYGAPASLCQKAASEGQSSAVFLYHSLNPFD